MKRTNFATRIIHLVCVMIVASLEVLGYNFSFNLDLDKSFIDVSIVSLANMYTLPLTNIDREIKLLRSQSIVNSGIEKS